MIKTGSQHIASLKDGRHVYIDGALSGDVTENPAFRRSIATVGALYDFQSRPENLELMTFDAPEAQGGRANRIWQLPHSYQDLVERRRALEAWAELHGGFLGRAPDHVASCLAGMYMGIDVFRGYDAARAGALADYFRFATTTSISLMSSSIRRPIDPARRVSSRIRSSLPGWLIRTARA